MRKGVFVAFWKKYSDGLEHVLGSHCREPDVANLQRPAHPLRNVTGAAPPAAHEAIQGGSPVVHAESLWPWYRKDLGDRSPPPLLPAVPSTNMVLLNSQFVASCPHNIISEAAFPFRCTHPVIYSAPLHARQCSKWGRSARCFPDRRGRGLTWEVGEDLSDMRT